MLCKGLHKASFSHATSILITERVFGDVVWVGKEPEQVWNLNQRHVQRQGHMSIAWIYVWVVWRKCMCGWFNKTNGEEWLSFIPKLIPNQKGHFIFGLFYLNYSIQLPLLYTHSLVCGYLVEGCTAQACRLYEHTASVYKKRNWLPKGELHILFSLRWYQCTCSWYLSSWFLLRVKCIS